MSWLIILVVVVFYVAALAGFLIHMTPVREAKHMPQDDDAIAVLESRLHRELKHAS